MYLPENEIHELGLMFINYQLVAKGYQSIFLGMSVPADSLADLKKYYDEIIFISYFTVKPEKAQINQYLEDFRELILTNDKIELWILGKMLNTLNLNNLPKGVSAFMSIQDLFKTL